MIAGENNYMLLIRWLYLTKWDDVNFKKSETGTELTNLWNLERKKKKKIFFHDLIR